MATPPATTAPGRPDIDPRYRLAWVPVAALLLAGLAAQSPLHDRLAEAIGDVGVRWVAPTAQFNELVVVDIDDASLQAMAPQLGDWPFRRDTYALLLGFLRDAGATTVVFDIVFVGPRQGDDVLTKAIAKRADVVLAASGMKQTIEDSSAARLDIDRLSMTATPDSGVTRWPAMSMPSQPLLSALDRPGSLGVISTPLDADGRLRRLPLVQQVDARVLPTLPVAALLVGMDENARVFSHTRSEVRVGAHRWPVDAQGMARVVLPTNADAVRTVSFEAVMRTALGAEDDPKLRTALAGRTVYVGSSAFLGDDVVTPHGLRSGTALLAMAHGALARDQVLKPINAWAQALLIGVALLPCVALCRRGRPALARDAIAALLALAAITIISLLWLTRGWQWIDVVTPVCVVLLGFILTAATQLRWTMRANRQLVHERAVAEAANRAKSEFLASVSHEIRTPLNAVLGMAEVLSRTDLSAEQRRYVDVFRSSGTTLCNLINDLLDLSKIEAGKLQLDSSVFSLHALLAEQMTLLLPQAEVRQIALTWHIDDNVGALVETDRLRLSQAIVNLVGNAIKFTQQGGVSIAVKREASGQLDFEVSDTGIGIASSKFELIFQPFTQADGGVTRSYGGTGLGLSITKSLVELMGGRIGVESQPGLGSTFRFTIDAPQVFGPDTAPVGARADVEGALPPVRPQMALAIHDVDEDVSKLPILLVDDNDVNLIVTEALLRDTGYRVDVAHSGEAAIGKFSSGRYSLVMMDVQMPGMDGLSATREIRRIEADQNRARTPVVALTANAFDSDERRSFEAGCDAHLTKPLHRQRLIDVVAEHARRPGHRRSTIAAAGQGGLAVSPTADSADEALIALNGDAALYQRLLAHATVFMGTWNRDFSAAMNASDASSALRLAHDLQSIAARIGKHALADAAASLDAALRFGDVEGVDRARAVVSQQVQAALISSAVTADRRPVDGAAPHRPI